MGGYSVRNVQIRNPVTICQQKRFATDIFLHTLKPAARHRIQTSVHQRYFPWLGVIVQNSGLTIGYVHRYVTVVKTVIDEIFFYYRLLVAAAYYKIIDTIM